MNLTKRELLEQLQSSVTAEEWEHMENRRISVSDFNFGVLQEMRSAEMPEDSSLDENQVSGLYRELERYLEKYLPNDRAAWKWICLSGLYLTFIAKRPMHPIDLLDIRVTSEAGQTIYECPQKSSLQNTPCQYCVCRRMSNYEITKRKMQKEFLKYSQEEMVHKFGLESDENYVYIRFLKHLYRVGRMDGRIEWYEQEFEKWQEADYNEAMTLYDILCCSKAGCCPAGEFIPLRNLSALKGSSPTHADKGFYRKEEELFDHQDEKLSRACQALDGIKKGKGDVAYEIPVFGSLSVLLQFWDSDEEFPASLQIFCDKNILDYMRYETVWYMLNHLMSLLKSAFSENTKEGTFPWKAVEKRR